MSAPRMAVPLDSLVGHPLTIKVDWDKDWCAAVCVELSVSGFGATPTDALESVARSIRSTIAAMSNNDSTSR